MVHSEIVLPPTRRRGWPTASAYGTRSRLPSSRKDAQLAREIQVAIPRELDRDSQIALVRDFVTGHFVARGMVPTSRSTT